MDSEPLTITQIAKLYKRTRQWAWNKYKKGDFPNARKVGNQIEVPVTDLKDLPTLLEKEAS